MLGRDSMVRRALGLGFVILALALLGYGVKGLINRARSIYSPQPPPGIYEPDIGEFPTDTPLPPTLEPMLFTFQDAGGDTVNRDTQVPYDDPPADLTRITVQQIEDALGDMIQIQVATAGAVPEHDYSYALVVYLEGKNGVTKAFLWQVHQGVTTAGEIDPKSFQPIPDSGASVSLEKGEMVIGFPPAYLIMSFMGSSPPITISMRLESYHMTTSTSVFSGDMQAGPFEFPAELIPPAPVP